MCYHYSISVTANEIARRYKISPNPARINPNPIKYHTNGFNFDSLPVVYYDDSAIELKLNFMRWGLIPGWVKGEEQAFKIRSGTLNARSETADSRPSFKFAFFNKPCLIPATGYYEWMHKAGVKFPFFIFLSHLPVFSFAGIWEEWVNKQTGEMICSFSILTCKSNSLTAKIHNTKSRMPVILDQESEDKWLDKNLSKTERKYLLKPYDSTKMDAYSISRLITDRKHNSNVPEVLNPFEYAGVSLA